MPAVGRLWPSDHDDDEWWSWWIQMTSFQGGIFPREISFSEKSRLGSLLPRTLGQSLSSASRPELEQKMNLQRMEEKVPWRKLSDLLFLAQLWGGHDLPLKTAEAQVAGEEKFDLCLFASFYSIHNLLHFVFFMEFCVPNFHVRGHIRRIHKREWDSETEIRWDFLRRQ